MVVDERALATSTPALVTHLLLGLVLVAMSLLLLLLCWPDDGDHPAVGGIGVGAAVVWRRLGG